MLYTASGIGMAGCCDGGDTQECGWASSCIDYDQYYSSSSCDTDCELNTFIRKCSNAASPYCVTWTYPGDDVADYGCADTSFSLEETVYQAATDTYDSYYTSMSLPTISGDAVTGYDDTSRSGNVATATGDDSDIFGLATGTDTDLSPGATGVPSTGGSRKKKKAKVSIAMIIGIVVGALFLLFVIGAVVIFICVKQKKKKQLANNQQAIAAAQSSRPQSQFQPQTQQPQMQQPQMQQPLPEMPPMPGQPLQPMEGYFQPQNPDQKFNPQTKVHEYPVSSPISNPSTPAPPYVQPYYAAPNAMTPPMPTQSPAPYQAREPTPGTHEVDAITVPHAQPGQQGQGGHVYEMGSGK